MRCPTGELNGFPRRKSIAAAATATNPGNQLTATASAADLSRDVPEGPRGGVRGGGALGSRAWPQAPPLTWRVGRPEAEGDDLTATHSAFVVSTHRVGLGRIWGRGLAPVFFLRA